jgi:hypothetical protein
MLPWLYYIRFKATILYDRVQGAVRRCSGELLLRTGVAEGPCLALGIAQIPRVVTELLLHPV